MDGGYFERYMLSKDKLLPEKVKAELNPFLDSYVMECSLRRDMSDDKKSRKRGYI
jgi:hypothetical protein